jgi:predicted RecB family nuclease
MYKKIEQLYYSPSDLTRYMESPFASWMDRCLVEHPEQMPDKDPADALMSSLAQKGYAHEYTLESEFIEQGYRLVKIEGESVEIKSAKTIEAMKDGADVIVQAHLKLEQFGGYADFLVKVTHAIGQQPSLLGNWHYEVWDTKLAKKIKPTFVIQLCCYAEMLESLQGLKPEFITVALGNGENEQLRTSDFYYYYQTLKSSFIHDQNCFNLNDRPDPADSKNWGDWSNFAELLLQEKDHLFQVATISKGQIKKLSQVGIITMQQLVDSKLDHVSGINPIVLAKLKAQAAIQKRSIGSDTPHFEIIKPSQDEKIGLALLPPHSPFDVFFDIEGYPLDEGGLEYLWGNTYFDENSIRQFIDFWAHDQEQEKQCFQDFITWVYQRWQQDPTMHIYHYANYEIAACRKLMGRYGVCEYEVDQLLRNEVFVDLYKIVKGGLLLGEPRYSIKNVEHLYRGKRETEVGNGGDSIVVYEQWRVLNQLGEQGDTWQTSKILNDIRDYNIDDCDSTQELVDWLRKQQAEHGIVYLGKLEVIEPDVKEEITERTQLRDRLLNRVLSELETNSAKAHLTENLAWVLEFHRREAQPVFWRLFERLGLSHVELLDDLDCLACCERTERKAFKPTPRARNLAYEFRFDPAQEFKGAQKQFYLLGIETDDGKSAKVTFVRNESDLDNGLVVLQSKEEPPSVISLVPDEYVNPNPIPQAIDQSVSEYEQGNLVSSHSAIIDFLTRSKPRIIGHSDGPIAASHDPKERLQQIIQAISNLDNSYLTIQGPPGAGKSYTGKHVIAELVKSGARVGVASNSHKAINNLVLSTAKYCAETNISASFFCTKDNEPELIEYGVTILKNNELVNNIQPRCVIGTTAWGFSREDMATQLDYLFVDEAGQVAIANLIAMSRSANNLILMGDQMQLGQPSQGTHPAESGLSILDYLLHESPTIPADMGVFLGTTYRMHSMVNQFISEHVYEGKLESHPDNDKRIIKIPSDYNGPINMEAGVVFVPVVHEGNTQASDEEVAEIKKLANDIIGRTFYTGEKNAKTRAIDWNDILFVAPYNHQVNKLRIALGEKAKVGSVDKFQGQEAPIVFLSMCASDASESPRGLDFLFDKHRINVAISRAQTLAVVVGNPNIGKTAVNRVEQLKLINLFNAVVANGQPILA